MISSFMAFALLFLGMALGSINPSGAWGVIIFLSVSTIFFILDLVFGGLR